MRHLIHKNAIMVCDIITLDGKWQPGYYKLTLSRPVFPLYRNQSVDLQRSLIVKGLNDVVII